MGQQLNSYGKFNDFKRRRSENKFNRAFFESKELDPKPIDLIFNRTDGSNTHLLQKMVMIKD